MSLVMMVNQHQSLLLKYLSQKLFKEKHKTKMATTLFKLRMVARKEFQNRC